jgi:cyclase
MSDCGIVKTTRFQSRQYIGDPINAVRIFNEKEVDELILLDIDATAEKREPQFDEIEQVLSEAFMPVGYGGGIRSMSHVERLFRNGVEKVIVNSVLADRPEILTDASQAFGAQSIVASMDIKRDIFGRFHAYTNSGKRKLTGQPLDILRRWEQFGAGEIIINSIDRDGTGKGFELDFIAKASAAVTVPVVAVGGAGNPADLAAALRAGSSAVGAGSMFIFHGMHRAVLISYVDRTVLESLESK